MKKYFSLQNLVYLTLGFLFSCSLLLKNEINYDGSIPTQFINEFHFSFTFFIKAFLISIPIIVITYISFKLLDNIRINNKAKIISNKKIFLISFFGLFFMGILHLITFYPGNIMIDTLYIFKSPMGMSAQHPLFYILIITLPFKIFAKIFNNLNLALFFTCTLQLTIASVIISFIITWFNKKFKNIKLTVILMLYFIILPIVTNYNTTLVKDSAFCLSMICLVPIIYEIINSEGNWIKNNRNILTFIIFTSLLCLIRNNGIYIVILLLLLFILIYKKYFKQWLTILAIVPIISFIPQLFSNKQLFQEKVGIPLQQISYVIHTDGKISKKNKEYLNKIYNYNLYKENYNPYLVDTIKWDINFNREYLNNNSSKFIKTWFETLPNNFEGYIKSYILCTYGNWSFNKFYDTQSIFLGVDGVDTNEPKLFPEIKSKNTFLNFMKPFYNKTTKYLSGGVCFWILIYISCYMIYKKKYKLLLLTIPLYGTWLSLMVATPFSMAFRYMSPFIYLLPLIVLITLIKKPLV